jgi:hypothetical protein
MEYLTDRLDKLKSENGGDFAYQVTLVNSMRDIRGRKHVRPKTGRSGPAHADLRSLMAD